MNADDLVPFLRSTPLFDALPDAALEAIARQLEPHDLPAGAELFAQGSRGESAYLVLEGWVRVVAGKVEIARRGPNGVVGEFALLDDQPRSASAVALTPVRLLTWRRSSFVRSLAADPLLGRGILRVLTQKLRDDLHESVELHAERDSWRHDLARARATQQGMLPPERISLPGLEVAGHCAPVDAVGGDFYDVLALGDDRSALLIADVTGSGFHAGLLVAMTKSALHTQARHDPGPAAMMSEMQRTVSLAREWSVMMSCACVLLDPRARRLSYANAGHPYPLHWNARDRTITALEALDVVLGVEEAGAVRYATRDGAWGRDDLLVLYSDGISEARDAHGAMFGRAGIEQTLATLGAHGARAATEVRDALLARVHEHLAEGAPDDDVTLVVARAT